MTDHALLAGFIAGAALLQVVGLLLLGLILREARRDTQRLAATMAKMALGLDAVSRRLDGTA